MNGGASQADLFDYKPELARRHGKPFDPGDGAHVEAATSTPGNVLKPPFPLRQHGQCGRWVSDQLPHLAKCVDDLAFFMAMSSRTNVHGPGSYLMNTGFLLPGFPCMGSWISYALGNLTDDLPTFVVLPDPRGLPYNGKGNFGSGFLPVTHQGTIIQSGTKNRSPICSPRRRRDSSRPRPIATGLALLDKINRRASRGQRRRCHARAPDPILRTGGQDAIERPGGVRFEARTGRKRIRFTGSINRHTADFGRRCLLARRLVERGVRFVQVWSGAGGPSTIGTTTRASSRICRRCVPRPTSPIAALLTDLKQRGLLDDTLVLWNTEFGRMPFSQGSDGRDHNGGTFVGWMAGRRRAAGNLLWRKRPLVVESRARCDDDLRFPRHGAASAWHRPQAAHGPPQRREPPIDGRAWECRQCRIGMNDFDPSRQEPAALARE